MNLVGEFHHALDAKNRLFIPAKFREELGESFYITRKTEKCLAVYSEEEWAKFTEKLNMLPDSKVGPLKQFIYSKTISVTPDSNGRVVLTPSLTAYAGIQKNVVVIGVGDQAQIWAEEAWTAKEEAVDLAAIAELMQQVGL